ncbi:hypothetical protein [Halalkalibacter krulwichiae]|uniref:Uncharacterized protein n=1 Tax=Halalkalibacter krulwichiae TaxID=199441 RepID=A0A1X9MDU4_9BACI|nr:hypothetical protein [Halalkalibacter krulwichiae]ARK31615.1 hypothetical protein BkAM31D_18175 [Halalkalibacter krulwichiae]
MELLDRLKEHYLWQEVRLVNEALIETEHGRKRLRYWSDRALLDWHIGWRDACSVSPYMLADRMIRNKDQKAAIEWKDGWLTVHDEVDVSFRNHQSGEKVGRMIATMVKYGLEANPEVTPTSRKQPLFKQLEESVATLQEDNRIVVESLLKESAFRMKKAEMLLSSLKEEPRPIIDPLTEAKSSKMIYDVFIWFGSTIEPERGYYSIRCYLLNWLKENGKESLNKLTAEMLENESFTREQAILLLAECLKPYELDLLVKELASQSTDRKIRSTINDVTKEWEHSKTLVEVLSTLIDQKKKVFQT